VTGCDAIHPGYGFLSEDEGFAEVVRAHGLTFIGPSAEVLERFASKEATRRILAAHGLPRPSPAPRCCATKTTPWKKPSGSATRS
jgi:acetyl/propionyl-CoA carboxylase alpha subunit